MSDDTTATGTDAIETAPGTEGDTETVVESAPAGDADQPAEVLDADGNPVPPGPDGIPVVSGDDTNPGSDDGEGDVTVESRLSGYDFRGIMAKRAERMRNRPLGTYGTEAPEVAEDAGFEPADATVAEVQAYLAENPDQSGYVLDRERSGKARVTLLGD